MLKKILLFTILLLVPVMIGTTLSVYADSSTMVGTLSAMLDSQNGTVTAMFVGYCGGEPVIIGPSTWTADAKDFSNASAEDIGNKLCGNNHTLKRVTKSTNTGKEMVAEVVISSPNAPILVGR
jgi:hypothetical protein